MLEHVGILIVLMSLFVIKLCLEVRKRDASGAQRASVFLGVHMLSHMLDHICRVGTHAFVVCDS